MKLWNYEDSKEVKSKGWMQFCQDPDLNFYSFKRQAAFLPARIFTRHDLNTIPNQKVYFSIFTDGLESTCMIPTGTDCNIKISKVRSGQSANKFR